MKRNMDLIRDTLLAIEQDETLDGLHLHIFNGPHDLQIENCSLEEFSYTTSLMEEAGFFQAEKGDMFFPPLAAYLGKAMTF